MTEPLSSTFDSPLTAEERSELEAMPSHELYLLTKMVPYGTLRDREVAAIYDNCLHQMVRVSRDG